MEKITPQELKNVIDKEEKEYVLDVRTLREYLDFRIQNIPFIPLELLEHIQRPEARWKKSRPIYVISYTEARSKAFCHRLEALGYRTFYIKEGGVEAWCRKHLSVVDILKNCQDTDKSALAITNGCGSNPIFNFEIVIAPIQALGHYFRSIVGIAWFFEKMNCNIKFVFAEDFNYFENSTLQVSQESSSENYVALQLPMREFDRHDLWITSDYACSLMSRLTIKREIQDEANEWIGANLKGNWIGVHYRGTDMPQATLQRSCIDMDTYISYLKKLLNKHHSIFVCSDQAQFIDRMNKSFPSRIFFRDIPRSYDQKPLHRNKSHEGFQQRKDALIDILVLSEAHLIYKTAGRFSILTRFFNPATKIISLIYGDRKYRRYLPDNFIPASEAHLLAK